VAYTYPLHGNQRAHALLTQQSDVVVTC